MNTVASTVMRKDNMIILAPWKVSKSYKENGYRNVKSVQKGQNCTNSPVNDTNAFSKGDHPPEGCKTLTVNQVYPKSKIGVSVDPVPDVGIPGKVYQFEDNTGVIDFLNDSTNIHCSQLVYFVATKKRKKNLPFTLH